MEQDFQITKEYVLNYNGEIYDHVIQSERNTGSLQPLDIPIAYALHERNYTTYIPHLPPTNNMLADLGTKPLNVTIHHRLKYWLMGEHFSSAPETKHYQDETRYVVILRECKKG